MVTYAPSSDIYIKRNNFDISGIIYHINLNQKENKKTFITNKPMFIAPLLIQFCGFLGHKTIEERLDDRTPRTISPSVWR